MGLFDFLKVKEIINEPNKIITYDGKELTDAPDVKDPALLAYATRHSYYGSKLSYRPANVEFYRSEYDLHSIANAINLDGILNRSVCVFTEQILKNGFENLVSSDMSQQHLNKRLKEIELGTNIKYMETLATISRQLVSYGNAYVIKVRGESRFGKKYDLFGTTKNPIIGLFIADATTMSVGISTTGKITHYQQIINGEEKIFKVDDVIHLTYNKIPGTLTGNSNINAILDDLRALRKLEEEIEILGFQYAVPLYLYKVGNDNHPAQPGEIDNVSTTVNSMPTYGIMVVPHTHDMKAVTQNNDPIDLTKYVSYFKQRIFSGLGVSPVAMGDSGSSNRSTSEIADLNMQTITKSYQQIIKNKIEQELLIEIILDGGFDPMRHDVEMRFPEIDLEAQIKKETHILQKFQGNLITRTEARKEADYNRPINEEDTYLSLVQIKLADAQNELAKDLATHTGDIAMEQAKVAAKATGVKTGGRSASVGKKSESMGKTAVKKTASSSNPTNQYGKQLGRPKTVKDTFIAGEEYINFIINNDSIVESNINNFKNKIITKYNILISTALNDSIDFYNEYYNVNVKLSNDVLNETIRYYDLLITDKLSRLDKIEDFDTSVDKISYITDSVIELFNNDEKIDNLAKIIVLNNLGYNSILFNADSCEKHASRSIIVNDINMDLIPPFNSGCKCFIEDYDV